MRIDKQAGQGVVNAREFEWSEEISRNFLQVLRATRKNSRKILKEKQKSGLGRNLEKERSSKQHPPVIFSHLSKSTRVSCVHFSSTWMSPVWNRIDKAGRAGVRRVGMERRNFKEISPSSASHSRDLAQDSQKRKFLQKRRTGTPKTKEHSQNNIP